MQNYLSIPDFIKDYISKSLTKYNYLHSSKMAINLTSEIKKWLDENNLTPKQVKYLIDNNLTSIPTCKNCGNTLKNFQDGHSFCCQKCASNSIDRKEKIKKTNFEKYGCENTFQSEKIKEKIKNTNLEKYGYEHYTQSNDYKEKYKQTCLKKYGCEYTGQADIKKQKTKETFLKKYGVECYTQSEQFKQQYKDACLEKYGVDNYAKSSEFAKTFRTSFRTNYYEKFLNILNGMSISLEMTKDEYVNDNILKYKCLRCNNTFETEKSNPQTIYCPHCFKQQYSIEEKELLEWIKSIYSGEIIENDRTILNGKELDIYIPEKKLAIEFNGDYWHRTEKVGKYYHQEKSLECRKQGIRLIHIFEYEWKNKQEICKSIIKSALRICDAKIYARQCVVKEISANDYKAFLELNHLQGSINSSIRYGLYYQDELVTVIGFGKSRFKKDEMELHRFCCKLNYSIIGGFSKLIKHSNIEHFITYVDLAHFSGDGYKSLGFKELSITSPNYKWVGYYGVYTRLQTQKHKLNKLLGENYNPEYTEVENMITNGYVQVFDSGNLKLEFKRGL